MPKPYKRIVAIPYDLAGALGTIVWGLIAMVCGGVFLVAASAVASDWLSLIGFVLLVVGVVLVALAWKDFSAREES